MDEAMLADALNARLGPVAIKGMTRLSGGASRETWAFDAIRADGSPRSSCCGATRWAGPASRGQ